MQNRKASAPAWSRAVFLILYIAAVVSVGLYAVIFGNQQFGWGIPFAQWAELCGMQALYQAFLLPNGLFYFAVIPCAVILLWGIIVLLLKMGAGKRLPMEQKQQEEETLSLPTEEEKAPSVSVEQAEEPEIRPETEETVTAVIEEEVSPEQESPAEPVSEPETVPVMAKRLSAEEIREMYRKSLLANQKGEEEDPFTYLSELYYQDREEKY